MAIVLAMAATALSPSISTANEITMTQVGDNFVMQVDQIGGNNVVKKEYDSSYSDISGDNNEFVVHQQHSDGVWNNIITIWKWDGDGNYVEVRQGSDTYGGSVRSDSTEYSGHFALVDIQSDDNTVKIGQRNPDSGGMHMALVGVFADDNDIEVYQGSTGDKYSINRLYNEGNTVDIIQHGNGKHYSDVYLDGNYSTTLTLEQSANTDKSYGLTQFCNNSAGCTISVTQN